MSIPITSPSKRELLMSIIKSYRLGKTVSESVWNIDSNQLFIKFRNDELAGVVLASNSNGCILSTTNLIQIGIKDTDGRIVNAFKSMDNDSFTFEIDEPNMMMYFRDKSRVVNKRPISDVSFIRSIDDPNPNDIFDIGIENFPIQIQTDDSFMPMLNNIKNIKNAANIAIDLNTNNLIVNYNDSIDVDSGEMPIIVVHRNNEMTKGRFLFNYDTFFNVLKYNDIDKLTLKLDTNLNMIQLLFNYESYKCMYLIMGIID